MDRDPERCELRRPWLRESDRAAFTCVLVQQILGTAREDAGRVTPETCRECCGYPLPSPTRLNPVIASLVYQGANQIAADGGATWREREEAVRSQRFVLDQLELVRDDVSVAGRGKDGSPAKALGQVGLVGWNTATGLGYINRDLATHLPIAKWLVPKHSVYPSLDPPRTLTRIDAVRLELETAQIKTWLRGLECVLFAEFPYFPRLAQCARELGIRVACVPMWELTDLEADWVSLCDLMICPTRYAY